MRSLRTLRVEAEFWSRAFPLRMKSTQGSLRHGAIVETESAGRAEGISQQSMEDHGYRRRSAPLADRLLLRRR